MSHTDEQVQSLHSLHGIDVEALLLSNLAKAEMQGILENFKSRFSEGRLVGELKENAIVGGQVLSKLMNDPLYVPFSNELGEQLMYAHGQIGATLVYFDPTILYGSTHIYTWDGEKPISVKVEPMQQMTEDGVTKYVLAAWVSESDEFDPCIVNSEDFL
jgi:hypothetical protein